jgi:hypothetical protein
LIDSAIRSGASIYVSFFTEKKISFNMPAGPTGVFLSAPLEFAANMVVIDLKECSAARDRIFRNTYMDTSMTIFFSHKAPPPTPDDRPPHVPDPEPDDDPIPDRDPE